MKRDITELSARVYDVAIIGGGIYGVSVAREAVSRGLSAALVDQGDFGHATSANSLKIVHGGVRYLQHGDLRRMRESIRERSTLLRIAPHVVRPMPFLLPTYRGLLPGKLPMHVALILNDLISFDRNWKLGPNQRIPAGAILSSGECLKLCPDLDKDGLTGGALFYDALVDNMDRLILFLLRSAAAAGASVANHVRVTGFLQKRETIVGFQAKDCLGGNCLDVRARIVVNCGGPWIDRILQLLLVSGRPLGIRLFKAVGLVTRSIVRDVAVGIASHFGYRDDAAIIHKGHRYMFMVPWRRSTVIGTLMFPFDGDPDDLTVTEDEIRQFLREVNGRYPAANLTRQDVHLTYAGLLPEVETKVGSGSIQPAKHYRIHDHEQADGLPGLVTVMGVKFTTARDVADKVIELVFRKLGKKCIPSPTATTPVAGGEIGDLDRFIEEAIEKRASGLRAEVIRHLIRTYGANYHEILRYGEEHPAWLEPITATSPVLRAEVIHSVREEMAGTLADFVLRRSELAADGSPEEACLEACADLMAQELDWSTTTRDRELAAVHASCRQGRLPR